MDLKHTRNPESNGTSNVKKCRSIVLRKILQKFGFPLFDLRPNDPKNGHFRCLCHYVYIKGKLGHNIEVRRV